MLQKVNTVYEIEKRYIHLHVSSATQLGGNTMIFEVPSLRWKELTWT